MRRLLKPALSALDGFLDLIPLGGRALAGGLFLCLCFGTAVPAADGGWQKIAPRELARMMTTADKPLLINTMGEIECRDHSIAGSLCLPTEEFEKRAVELPPDRNRMVVLYCESDASLKSCEAADLAVRKGYRSVRVLDGGMPAWKRAGYETVSSERIPRRAVPSLKPEALRQKLAAGGKVVLLDIRPEKAFGEGHIAGAVNIPMVQLHRRWRELPIDRPLILVDNRGFRSLLAAGYLAARGYSVERLFGGMSAWKAATAPGKDKRP